MNPSALTRPGSSPTSTVEVETKDGKKYSFPAMDKHSLDTVIPKGSKGIPKNTLALSMINGECSVLSIPFPVIVRVAVDGEDWWTHR